MQALKWFVDGDEVGYDGNGAPWVKGWDSSSLPNGTYEIHSLAKQPSVSPDAGRWFKSSSITVTVDNTSEPAPSRAPRSDLDGWDHIYADDFDDPVPTGGFPDGVSEEWNAYPSPWRDTSGKGRVRPGAASCRWTMVSSPRTCARSTARHASRHSSPAHHRPGKVGAALRSIRGALSHRPAPGLQDRLVALARGRHQHHGIGIGHRRQR